LKTNNAIWYSALDEKFRFRVNLIWPEYWGFRYSGLNVPSDVESWWKPWLIHHIGNQGEMWQWDLADNYGSKIEIGFINQEDLTYFYLRWG
jgi:hypothetical protein